MRSAHVCVQQWVHFACWQDNLHVHWANSCMSVEVSARRHSSNQHCPWWLLKAHFVKPARHRMHHLSLEHSGCVLYACWFHKPEFWQPYGQKRFQPWPGESAAVIQLSMLTGQTGSRAAAKDRVQLKGTQLCRCPTNTSVCISWPSIPETENCSCVCVKVNNCMHSSNTASP